MLKKLFALAGLAGIVAVAGCVSTNPHASSTKIYIQQKNNEKAMAEAQAWAESDPTSGSPYLWMGLIKASQEDYPGAADEFIKAFEIDSTLKSMEALDKELTISGAQVFDGQRVYQVIINAAISKINENKPKEAAPYLEKAIELNPNDAKAYLLLVNVYEQAGDMDKAKKALATADEKDPNNPQVKLHLALFAEQDGKLDQAEKLLKEALKIDTAYAEAYKELGFVNFERGKKLEEKFDKAKTKKEKESIKKDIQKYYKAAAENFDKATNLDDKLDEAWLNLGISYIKLEKLPEAVKALEKYTSMKGNDYNGWFLLAGALAASEDKADHEKALEAVNTAISIKETPDAYNLKGAVLKKLKRKKEAMKAFKKAMELEAKK